MFPGPVITLFHLQIAIVYVCARTSSVNTKANKIEGHANTASWLIPITSTMNSQRNNDGSNELLHMNRSWECVVLRAWAPGTDRLRPYLDQSGSTFTNSTNWEVAGRLTI